MIGTKYRGSWFDRSNILRGDDVYGVRVSLTVRHILTLGSTCFDVITQVVRTLFPPLM